MKKIIFFCILINLSFDVLSQNFLFAKGIGGANGEIATAVAVDKYKNVYTSGFSGVGLVDFDPGPGVYNINLSSSQKTFILKLDSGGNFVWVKLFGLAHINNLKCDSIGNIFAVGNFSDSVDFDPSASVNKKYSNGNRDFFILKLNSLGNLIWVNSMGGTGLDDVPSIALDYSGNILLTGNFTGSVDFDPSLNTNNLTTPNSTTFIAKYSSNGAYIWSRKLDVSIQAEGLSINVDTSNNVYSTGIFKGQIDMDPGVSSNILSSVGSSSFDIYISKLDPFGNYIFGKSLGGQNGEWVRSINISKGNIIYLTGSFSGIADFDPGLAAYNLTSTGVGDIFISILDNLGNFGGAYKIGGTGNDQSLGASLDLFGNLYITGTFEGTVDFDPYSGVYNLISNGSSDIFILKLSTNNGFQWAGKLGGTGTDQSWAICTDNSNNIYTTGSFNGNADFDPGLSNYSLNSNGLTDLFVSKICSPPNTGGFISGQNTVCENSTYTYSYGQYGATSYNWSFPSGTIINSGQNSSTISVTFAKNSGTIFVTPLNSCGNGVMVNLSVTVNALPTLGVTITPNDTVCEGTNLILTGTGASTYIWSDGVLNGQPFYPSISKSYTLTGTGTNGCSKTLSIPIVVNPKPVAIATIAGPSNFCQGDSTMINANTGSGLAFQWLKNNTPISGKTSSSIYVTSSGNYSVIAKNINGCSDTSSEILVTVNPKPIASTTPSGNVSICQGKSISISANSGTGYTYIWLLNNNPISNATSKNYSATIAGNYQVKVTNSNGCYAVSPQIVVLVNSNPTSIITAQGPTTFCQGSSVILNSTNTNGLTFRWLKNNAFNGTTNSNYSATTSGSYRLVVSNINSCRDTSTPIVVTANTLPNASITAQGPIVFCTGKNVNLIGNTGIGLTYQWLKNSTAIIGQLGPNYIANTSGIFQVQVTDQNSCRATSNSINVTVNINPVAGAIAGQQTGLITNTPYLYNINQQLNHNYSWLISNGNIISGQGTNAVTVQWINSGTCILKAIIINSFGCADTATWQANIGNPTPVIISFTPTSATTNSTINILGANLNGATSVKFGGVNAISYNIISPNQINAIVGNGATGQVQIETPIGTAQKAGFTYILPSGLNRLNGLEGYYIYPNPSSQNIYICCWDKKINELKISITDLLGRVLPNKHFSIKNNEVELSTQDLISGTYIINIQYENEIYRIRFIKE
jgi:hypothetical protein